MMGNAKAACCIAYNTDATYLFPTFVSALQARRFSSEAKADVFLFCTQMDAVTEAVFAPICEREDIHLVSLSNEVVEGQNAMLARLFMNRYVPTQYTQYLYLDGDVQILDSLDPLIDIDVPAGRFLAANDPSTFLLEDNDPQSRDLAAHFKAIGLTRKQALFYFNSGVLRIARDGWDEIGMASWRYFQSVVGPARFPDQDALNVVGVHSHIPMSLAWNFPIFMRNARVETEIKPRILHFMSSPKPWHGTFPPWTQDASKPYADVMRKYPALVPFGLTMPLQRQAKYQLQQRVKKALELATWGFSERRKRILHYELECAAPVGSLDPVGSLVH